MEYHVNVFNSLEQSVLKEIYCQLFYFAFIYCIDQFFWDLYTSIAILPPGELSIVLVRSSLMYFHPQAVDGEDPQPDKVMLADGGEECGGERGDVFHAELVLVRYWDLQVKRD